MFNGLKPLDNPRGWHVVCPVCRARAVYSRDLDRYFHVDGSVNVQCWVAISRGEHPGAAPRVAGHQAPAGEPGRAA